MKIKTELIKSYISDYICSQIDDFEIDEDKTANEAAVNMLSKI